MIPSTQRAAPTATDPFSVQEGGQMIGQNDLWIAETGLANDHSVVTPKVSEFARVPGLKVLDF